MSVSRSSRQSIPKKETPRDELPEGGGTLMWMKPLQVNKKHDDEDDELFNSCQTCWDVVSNCMVIVLFMNVTIAVNPNGG